jgi:hypothetical protein
MEIKYTIRIKEEHNPPTFKDELGKGVVATQVADFKGLTKEDLESPSVQMQIFELAEKLKNEWFEVVFEINNP